VKLPLSWLADWVKVPTDARELARQLTMAGFEVEAITPAAPAFSGVITAKIISAEPHPQAEKLQVCRVSTGSGEPLQIVCGAANARAGLISALATVGAVLPNDVRIKATKLRGVESVGMLCSARELGLAEASNGIIELPADTPVGADLRVALLLEDSILEINVTPNRGDAMSVLGIAREVAALSGATVTVPALPRGTRAGQARHIDASIDVRLQPHAGAARFVARVIHAVDNRRSSPPWLIERLRRAGVRSISPVVDVTNYVLLELGQPMHGYDAQLIQGGVLEARAAIEGETLTLLDGRDVSLQAGDLVIADSTGAVGLAGIMGGARTAISAESTQIVLESAWFDPNAMAGRARRYGLLTDASQRFERGVDPAGQERAIERATALLLEIAGGAVGSLTSAQLPDELPRRVPVRLRSRQLQRLLGAPVAPEAVTARLAALALVPARDGEDWNVSVPSWRFDIAIEADLIEEVVRIGGLESIPEADARTPLLLKRTSSNSVDERSVTQLLVARGYWQAVTFAFVDPQLQSQLLGEQPVIALANPIASDLAVLRASLWPGLVAAARENIRRQQERVRLFEIATRFLVEGAQTREQKTLAGLALGSRWPEQWGAGVAAVDFFDVRADLEAVLTLGGEAALFGFEAAEITGLHPGRSAQVLRSGVPVGAIGELHPQLVRVLDFTYAPILFEIDYEAALRPNIACFHEVSRFPQIRRDISITVGTDVPFGRIRERVSVVAASLLKELRIFDIYQGGEVESGRKSVALGLILQDLNRTLTDDDADRLIAAVLRDLQTNLDARIRE
jgi:phenylalanyl-tRNA synthetase beta chain